MSDSVTGILAIDGVNYLDPARVTDSFRVSGLVGKLRGGTIEITHKQ
jgi:hypothetical protein